MYAGANCSRLVVGEIEWRVYRCALRLQLRRGATCEMVEDDREQAESAAIQPTRSQTHAGGNFSCFQRPHRCVVLFDDGELRRVDVERFVLAGAALRVLRGYGVAHDSGGRIIRDDPLRHPELPFGLLLGLAIAHRYINGLAIVGQMNHDLRGTVPLSGGGIDNRHPEPHRLSPFVPTAQRAAVGLVQAEEENGIPVHAQVTTAGGVPARKEVVFIGVNATKTASAKYL